MTGKHVFFPPFTLDIADKRLRRGSQNIPLRPKSLAVLIYLVEHPHELVTKDALMAAVWPKSKVVEAALRVSIQEIRKTLGDDAGKPKFLETAAKNGYRFVAPVSLQIPSTGSALTAFVGRGADLERLQNHLELADAGNRQIVFVTGEPGIGKTTLVEAFSSHLAGDKNVLIGHGQCIEQYGTGEAYLPILDVLDGLCRLPNGSEVLDGLRRFAPSWLASLPALASAEERGEAARQAVGITPERRMREIAVFLEQLSKGQALILVLEDLHWVDPSTLSLIGYLARRSEPARLMFIGTYRGGEIERLNHPLKATKQELQLHALCRELPLKFLTRGAVGDYLAARFEAPRVSPRLLSYIYRRSEGNPLFMVNVTDYLVSQETLVQQAGTLDLAHEGANMPAPANIHQLIKRQMESLESQDRELLVAASVAGMNFSAAAVAPSIGSSIEQVEDRCEKLAEHEQFLQASGTTRWPDGTISSRYEFIHALYQNDIYGRIPNSRRARLHSTVGARLEAGYRNNTGEVAAELAAHFECAGDCNRALRYLLEAAEKALHQCGYEEAINYARKGLSLVTSLPVSAARGEITLGFELILGVSFSALRGFGAVEAKNAFSRAHDLCAMAGKAASRFRALAGLWSFYVVIGDLNVALQMAEQMLRLAKQTRNRMFLLHGHVAAGMPQCHMGDFAAARSHLEKSNSIYSGLNPGAETSVYGWDAGVVSAGYTSHSLWFLGYPELSLKQTQFSLALAEKLSSPFNHAAAYALAALAYAYRSDAKKTLSLADSAITTAAEGGFHHWLALGYIVKGWALAHLGSAEEGVRCLASGIQRWEGTGAALGLPAFHFFLAEAYRASKQFDKAMGTIDKGIGISQRNKEHYYDAELYRLKGELLGIKSKRDSRRAHDKAEGCFKRAVDIARTQKACSLELRAVLSLARLWHTTAKGRESHRTLAKIYGWFTEGFDTPDLKAAKELLAELS